VRLRRRLVRLRRLRLLRFDGAWSRASRGAAGKRQQRDVAGTLDGYAEPTLMASAYAGHAARENLAALLHELRKNVGSLVVDKIHLFDTELTDFLFAKKLAFAAARSSRTTRTTTGAAFTTSAATRAALATWAAAVAAFVARCLLRCRGLRSRGLRFRRRWRCLILFVCHDFLPFSMPGLVKQTLEPFLSETLRKMTATEN
jgi:hypothetical protein